MSQWGDGSALTHKGIEYFARAVSPGEFTADNVVIKHSNIKHSNSDAAGFESMGDGSVLTHKDIEYFARAVSLGEFTADNAVIKHSNSDATGFAEKARITINK